MSSRTSASLSGIDRRERGDPLCSGGISRFPRWLRGGTSGRSRWTCLEHRVHDIEEPPDIERFRQIVAGARGKQSVDPARGRISGDHDHWDPPRHRVITQATQCLLAGYIGQMDVQEDEIRVMLAGKFQPELALDSRDELEPRTSSKDLLDQPEIGEIVL